MLFSLCLEVTSCLITRFSFTAVLHNLSHLADPLPPTTGRLLTLFCVLLSQGLLDLPRGNFYPARGGFAERTTGAHSPLQDRRWNLKVTLQGQGSLWPRGAAGCSSHVPGSAYECCFPHPGGPQGPACVCSLGEVTEAQVGEILEFDTTPRLLYDVTRPLACRP